MSRSSLLILLGAIVLLAPFIGVPHGWIALIESVCGIILAGLGIAMRSDSAEASKAAQPLPPAPPSELESHQPSSIA